MELKPQDILTLLRDLQSRTDNVRDFLSTEIREFKECIEEKLDENQKATNSRLDMLEKKILEHDHRWNVFKTIFGWAFSGISLTAIVGILVNYIFKFFH